MTFINVCLKLFGKFSEKFLGYKFNFLINTLLNRVIFHNFGGGKVKSWHGGGYFLPEI